MTNFETKHTPMERDVIAPDGSDVRILLRLENHGSMAHFELGPGQISKAVTHRTVEEIWYFLTGRGQMWRKQNGVSETVDIYPGICITIPLGTHFQFRSFGFEPLSAIGVTIPSWPEGEDGNQEAIILKAGEWQPTVG